MPVSRITVLALVATLGTAVASARGVYQTPQDFVDHAFPESPPQTALLWIRGDLKTAIESVLQHAYGRIRLRYWRAGPRSAWILEETGKEQPITVGLVVENNRLLQIKVLEYRESRGDEVRHGFFTDQFVDAGLTPDLRLDRGIDGITGATLSVRALEKLARLALLLHQHSGYQDDPP